MAIPHIIHQIWVGGSVPTRFDMWRKGWQEQHPAWDYKLWTDEDVSKLHLANQAIYNQAEKIAPNNVGQLRSDILRLEILLGIGGVYVDVDFQNKKPLDLILDSVNCFAAWEVQNVWVNNAIMGSEPNHQFINLLLDELPNNVKSHKGARPNVLTGPQFITPLYKSKGRSMGVTIFDKRLFYPYLYNELYKEYTEFPDAIAIHHWNNRRTNSGL